MMLSGSLHGIYQPEYASAELITVSLAMQFHRKTDRWMDFLFNLLAVTYGNRAANEIRENIEDGSFQSVNYAHRND